MFLHFFDTGTAELTLFAFDGKYQSRHWWPVLADTALGEVLDQMTCRGALQVMWFHGSRLLSSTSALEEVFKLRMGFVDIVKKGEFPCLRTFGITEVVVGDPLTKSRLG